MTSPLPKTFGEWRSSEEGKEYRRSRAVADWSTARAVRAENPRLTGKLLEEALWQAEEIAGYGWMKKPLEERLRLVREAAAVLVEHDPGSPWDVPPPTGGRLRRLAGRGGHWCCYRWRRGASCSLCEGTGAIGAAEKERWREAARRAGLG